MSPPPPHPPRCLLSTAPNASARSESRSRPLAIRFRSKNAGLDALFSRFEWHLLISPQHYLSQLFHLPDFFVNWHVRSLSSLDWIPSAETIPTSSTLMEIRCVHNSNIFFTAFITDCFPSNLHWITARISSGVRFLYQKLVLGHPIWSNLGMPPPPPLVNFISINFPPFILNLGRFPAQKHP